MDVLLGTEEEDNLVGKDHNEIIASEEENMSFLHVGADGKPVCEQEEDRHVGTGVKEDDKPIPLLTDLTSRRRMGPLIPRRM